MYKRNVQLVFVQDEPSFLRAVIPWKEKEEARQEHDEFLEALQQTTGNETDYLAISPQYGFKVMKIKVPNNTYYEIHNGGTVEIEDQQVPAHLVRPTQREIPLGDYLCGIIAGLDGPFEGRNISTVVIFANGDYRDVVHELRKQYCVTSAELNS